VIVNARVAYVIGTRPGVGPEAFADYAALSMGQSEVLPSQVWDGEQKYTASRISFTVVVLRAVLFRCLDWWAELSKVSN